MNGLNIVQLTRMINSLENNPVEDLIAYYKDERAQLVATINADLKLSGYPPMTLRDLLLSSPEPRLAATV